MSNQTIRTAKKREAFLAALAVNGNVTQSCTASGLPRATAYEMKSADDEFATHWEAALDRGVDALEDEAMRRAFAGSDTLLIFLLKCRRPARYRDQVDVTNSNRQFFISGTPEPYTKTSEEWLEQAKKQMAEADQRRINGNRQAPQ